MHTIAAEAADGWPALAAYVTAVDAQGTVVSVVRVRAQEQGPLQLTHQYKTLSSIRKTAWKHDISQKIQYSPH